MTILDFLSSRDLRTAHNARATSDNPIMPVITGAAETRPPRICEGNESSYLELIEQLCRPHERASREKCE